jgi:hypothetical protein
MLSTPAHVPAGKCHRCYCSQRDACLLSVNGPAHAVQPTVDATTPCSDDVPCTTGDVCGDNHECTGMKDDIFCSTASTADSVSCSTERCQPVLRRARLSTSMTTAA